MYLLTLEMLEAGDVVLSRVRTLRSKGIRFVTKSQYSHAMLYVGFGSVIHSDGSGVHSQNIQRIIVQNKKDLKVLRLRTANPEATLRAIDFARASVGTAYTRIGAVGAVLVRARQHARANRQFCSRLVAEAYEHGGIRLASNPHFCSPAGLARSGKYLREVFDCVRPATTADLLRVKSINILAVQQKATNLVLKVARERTGCDVQTIEQLFAALVTAPESDPEISSALLDSGYLDLWRHDLKLNQWRYDSNAFRMMPMKPEAKLAAAKFELESSVSEKRRFVQFLSALQAWMPDRQSTVREQFLDLYQRLLTLSSQRAAVAKLIIDELVPVVES